MNRGVAKDVVALILQHAGTPYEARGLYVVNRFWRSAFIAYYARWARKALCEPRFIPVNYAAVVLEHQLQQVADSDVVGLVLKWLHYLHLREESRRVLRSHGEEDLDLSIARGRVQAREAEIAKAEWGVGRRKTKGSSRTEQSDEEWTRGMLVGANRRYAKLALLNARPEHMRAPEKSKQLDTCASLLWRHIYDYYYDCEAGVVGTVQVACSDEDVRFLATYPLTVRLLKRRIDEAHTAYMAATTEERFLSNKRNKMLHHQ